VKKYPFRGLRGLTLGLIGLALAQANATAQFDATIGNITVIQGIQTGTTALVGGRTTMIRVETNLSNPPSSPVNLDGVLRVFINNVEVPESPLYSINGPYPAVVSPNLNQPDGTLNFYYLPPVAANVRFQAEINPQGPNFVPEVNTANNFEVTGLLDFIQRGQPEFAYVPIDYRPGGGGTPNLPPTSLTDPGKGDNFIMGIYPTKDIDYHRTDAPSKLWTGDLSGSGTALLNSLLADLALMNPQPDFLYGWVNGGLPYNGVSFLNSSVAMGNTQSFKHQRTYAHEVGHNVGRGHVNWLIGTIGVDQEHHLHLPLSNNIAQIKPANLNDIMVAGLNTNQAWVTPTNYNYFGNHPKMQATESLTYKAPVLMVNGIWNRETGEVSLSHVLNLPSETPSASSAPEETLFNVQVYSGGDMVQALAVPAGTNLDTCADDPDSVEPVVEVGIHFNLQLGAAPIDRLEITPASGTEAASVTLVRSPNAPQVQFVTPGKNGDVSAGVVKVSWAGQDADGDPITYYLRYSNNGTNFTPLATGITQTEWTVDLTQLPGLVDGKGFFQLLASDGLNTTVVDSDVLFGGGTIGLDANEPWIYIVTPDPNATYQKGTTVFLHSSGWDIEDKSINGSAIQWTSNLDGSIGSGRLTTVANLSVGVHTITATITDSGGLMSNDTVTVTITDRDLPGLPPGPYCTAGTSASGCQAMMSSTGTPSASASTGFFLNASSVEGQKDGLFFWGTNGRQANVWGNGTSFQCVIPPVFRAGLLTGNGTAGACDGSFSQDMNVLWTAKPQKNPGSGAVVQSQLWYRDPQNTSNQTTSLSNALEFVMVP